MSQQSRINWIVRPACTADKTAVDAVLTNSYTNLLTNDYDRKILDQALPILCVSRPELLECKTWYVVEHPETGNIVGCGGWTPLSPFGEKSPHLRHFATDPLYLRKGVAKALWTRCWEDWCEYAGSNPRPSLHVFSTLTGVPFYESIGFKKIEDSFIPLSKEYEFPIVKMRRDDE